jgi:Tfp pilus assembly protein PilF
MTVPIGTSITDLYAWDWASAEKEYKRALALNPNYATAHHRYDWHLIVMGRTAEGIAESKEGCRVAGTPAPSIKAETPRS